MDKVLETLEGWDASHVLALLNALGGSENAADIAAGRKKVTVEDVIRILFDQHGRGIPFPGMKGIVDADRSFRFVQPVIDYADVLARLQEFFDSTMKFMPVSEFQERCQVAIERVKGNRQIANLMRGPYFPFVIPQLTGDLGQILDDVVLPALNSSYCSRIPGQEFINSHHDNLAGQVAVIAGTRQERLIKAMVEGSVCGVYFPALQGFSIQADREFISYLPEYLILSGMEVPVVVTAYPSIFGRDCYTPTLNMSAFQWGSALFSLSFGVFSSLAMFEFERLDAGNGSHSGGVSILG